jgi:HEAT repeat protein
MLNRLIPAFTLGCLVSSAVADPMALAPHGGSYSGPGSIAPADTAPAVPVPTGNGDAATPTGGGEHGPDCGPTPLDLTNRPNFAGGPTSRSGGGSGPDLTRWDYWWAFNRDPFLSLKAAIESVQIELGSDDHFLGVGDRQSLPKTRRPSDAQVRGEILPALLHALDTDKHNPVLSGSLVAVARIGRSLPARERMKISQRLLAFLVHPNQEVHETAALCLGLLADDVNVDALVALLHDTKEGRALVGEVEVDIRTRAFAVYGLGLLGQANSNDDLRVRIVTELAKALDAPNAATRDVKVAAMLAFGLVPLAPDPGIHLGPVRTTLATLEDQIAYLCDYFDARSQRSNPSSRHAIVRSHAPRALVRLLEQVHPAHLPKQRARVADLLTDAALGRSGYREDELSQGAVLASGALGRLGSDPSDVRLRKAILDVASNGSEQARRFALVGLGQLGGRPGDGPEPFDGLDEIRTFLRKELTRETSPRRPWAALAIGIQGRMLHGVGLALEPATSKALLDQASKEENPETIGAYALALGLRRDLEAWDLLLARLDTLEGRDSARGYCAVALGLMDVKDAADPVLELVRESAYRPDLIRQAATGLALLRQVHAVPELVQMLGKATATSSQAALCGALGRIGDRDAIAPLLALLKDPKATGNARSFAAVALGLIGDSEPLPWSVELSRDVHYRATTSTLIGGGGVLDIF